MRGKRTRAGAMPRKKLEEVAWWVPNHGETDESLTALHRKLQGGLEGEPHGVRESIPALGAAPEGRESPRRAGHRRVPQDRRRGPSRSPSQTRPVEAQ